MYRLFLLKEQACSDDYEKCLQLLREASPQIFNPAIVNYHNFLPKHIYFQSKMLSDEGVYKIIKEWREKSWKLLKEPTRSMGLI